MNERRVIHRAKITLRQNRWCKVLQHYKTLAASLIRVWVSQLQKRGSESENSFSERFIWTLGGRTWSGIKMGGNSHLRFNNTLTWMRMFAINCLGVKQEKTMFPVSWIFNFWNLMRLCIHRNTALEITSSSTSLCPSQASAEWDPMLQLIEFYSGIQCCS